MRPPLPGGLFKCCGGGRTGLLLALGHRIDLGRKLLAAILMALAGLGKVTSG